MSVVTISWVDVGSKLIELLQIEIVGRGSVEEGGVKR
jgi:hypothetical protein